MCPFEKVKLHKRLEHKFSSALQCCVRNIFNSSKGAFCCLFFKYLDTRNSYRSFQGGTLTTLSELGFHSLTCHCDQSLRMVFRWRTRDLLPAPPQTGSRHFLLFRVRSRQAQNSRQLPSSSNSSVALHKTTWLVGYLYV